MPQTDQHVIRDLLDHLALGENQTAQTWNGWQIEHIDGGMNNRLFRARNGESDYAVKFTIRDAQDRAGREWAALTALRETGLVIAPKPVRLERDRYEQPVIVQTWLAGEVHEQAPTNDAEWTALLEHLVAIHSVTPTGVQSSLQRGVLNFSSVDEGLRSISAQMEHIPPEEQPKSLSQLIATIERLPLPNWKQPDFALCRVDPNIRNFIQRPHGWVSVDWENSGWGDPAFEIADLLSHPCYVDVSPKRRRWLIDRYCGQCRDRNCAVRIRTYYLLMLIWWSARLARMLYEIPLGLDERLVARPPTWEHETRYKFKLYLKRAEQEIQQ